MIRARLSTESHKHLKTPETFNVEWAHQEAKRLLLGPEYRFEEERSENIHIYESNQIRYEQSIITGSP
jgi:hypothetical protein